MPKKEEYQNTKMSPIIFAVLLIIVLLMFAIGKKIDHSKPKDVENNQITTKNIQEQTKEQ